MKKLIALILALTLVLALTACGKGKKSGTLSGDEAQEFIDNMIADEQQKMDGILPDDAIEDMGTK